MNPNPNQNNAEANKEDPQLVKRRRLLTILFAVLPILLLYLMFKVFPLSPWPAVKDGDSMKLIDATIWFFWGKVGVTTSLEERLMLLVIVMGAIGSYIHAATSFSTFVGNNDFAKSWTTWYLLRPFIGISLALVVYAAIRGGLLLIINSKAPDATGINPFGVAAIAGLTGMFSKQAADKLNEVFSTIFKSAGDEQRKDSLTPVPAPEIKSLDPVVGFVTGGDTVTITGTGFIDKATVTFGGQDATDIIVRNDTTLTAITPPHEAGKVDVIITNSDRQTHTLPDGFEYVEGPPPPDEDDEQASAATDAGQTTGGSAAPKQTTTASDQASAASDTSQTT